MFGHQDTNDATNQNGQADPQADASLDSSAPAPADNNGPVETSEVDEALKALAAHSEAAAEDKAAEEAPVEEAAPASKPEETRGGAPVDTDPEISQLLDLKQNALQQLAPLFDKLDQSPEERFRTSMMMIQASDNQSLLPAAYEAAQQIEDEKAKAQALLDVVNEINYFTQQGSSEA